MPKAFSEREKGIIHSRLLEKGGEIFAVFGVRKTSIDDLAAAAGISKGAFYLFYDSKEELYLEIIEKFETEYKKKQLSSLVQAGKPLKQSYRETIREAFQEWKNSPLFNRFNKDELNYLMLKIPPEKMASHFSQDDHFSEEILKTLNNAGANIKADSQKISGLMKALFFISMHEDDFRSGDYQMTIDLLIEMVANYVFGKE